MKNEASGMVVAAKWGPAADISTKGRDLPTGAANLASNLRQTGVVSARSTDELDGIGLPRRKGASHGLALHTSAAWEWSSALLDGIGSIMVGVAPGLTGECNCGETQAGKEYLTMCCQEIGWVGLSFECPEAPCLTTVPIKSAAFSVTRIRKELAAQDTLRVDLPACEAYFLMLYLKDARHCDNRPDGSQTQPRRYGRGSVCLVDLQKGASIELRTSLHALAFVLPKALFNEVAEMSCTTKLHRLRCRRGEPDVVLGNLGIALMPLFESDSLSAPALLQHMATAVCAHLLHDYRDETLRNGVLDSSLSVCQEKAAKEFMLDNLAGELSVASIASATGLSANHFSQEFKKATGFTPHQWLTRMRIDRAKEMLSQHVLPLKTVAAHCGFADQSYFTKVFSRETGMTPAAWRGAWMH